MALPFPLPAGKIKSAEELAEIIRQRQADGEKIVLTNGVFDLLHVGHARYLAEARALGDALIVAVNSDDSVRGFKDPLRPIVPLAERMELLASLACVDYVAAFETRTPVPLIECVRPLIYAKGGDYTLADLPEAAVVLGYGGSVRILSLIAGRSTTNIIARVCAAYCGAAQSQPG